MIESLRENTKTLHQELERTLIPVIKHTSTTEQYVHLLQLFYGYYYPLEQHIAAHIGTDMPGSFEQRRKAAWLLQDIAAVTGATPDPANIPTSNDIPEITDTAQALGAMYVLEGSTLGGQVISSILQRNLANPSLPLAFFAGYGDNTRAMWDSFVHYLDGYRGNETQRLRLLNAAADTFRLFKKWAQANQ
jgi:heme oxygenase (biliverdin-IX-beta and delta-forming)